MNNEAIIKSNLRIMGLGLGSYVTKIDGFHSDTAQRLIEYGQYFTEYCTIIKTPNLPRVYCSRRFSDTVSVRPTLSDGILTTLFRMIQLGYEAMRSTRFDVVVAQEPLLTGLAGIGLRQLFKVPLCVSLHEDILDNPHWIAAERRNQFLNHLGKAVVRRADFVRVVSHEQEKYVINTLKVPAKRVMWAPVRMDFEIFRHANGESIRSELTTRGVERVLLFVGRLVIDKNIGFLLQVFAKIVAQYPSAYLILVGDGPELERIQQKVITLGISEQVIFKGWLPLEKVAEYMAASDLLVLTSYQEAFGRVVLEAGATGIPTISTDCAGPRELIKDGVTGYLVPIDDIDEMARKVLFLLQNPKVAADMGRKAQQVIQKEYASEQLTYLTVEMLRQTAHLGLRKNRTNPNAN